jgi:hypothetical protein
MVLERYIFFGKGNTFLIKCTNSILAILSYGEDSNLVYERLINSMSLT